MVLSLTHLTLDAILGSFLHSSKLHLGLLLDLSMEVQSLSEICKQGGLMGTFILSQRIKTFEE